VTHMFTLDYVRKRLGTSALAIFAIFASPACDTVDPLESTTPAEAPAGTDLPSEGPVDGIVPELATSYSGRSFGPQGLWSSYTSVKWGPLPFSGSSNSTDPNGIVKQINAARQMKQRLLLAMTGIAAKDLLTNGKFDISKWKKRMNSFNTSTIRSAVANAVSDGTVVGNTLIDEPETKKWGGNITKSMIDDMAAYAKNIFPTLPMGILVGAPAYRWRTSERYRKLDWVVYSYKWWITSGNVTSWRNAVLDQARIDGVTPAFSLNILDGGVPDRSGSWDCPGSGKGTYAPNCRMTADQLRSWGQALVGYGCQMHLWRFDYAFVSKSTNLDALKNLASKARSLTPRSCKRA